MICNLSFREAEEHNKNLQKVLLQKVSKWNQSTECQNSFEKFKNILQSDLFLTHYNPQLPNIVDADASNTGIWACISHEFSDSSINAIQHASRTLTKVVYGDVEKLGNTNLRKFAQDRTTIYVEYICSMYINRFSLLKNK